jgi:hypothetical protein
MANDSSQFDWAAFRTFVDEFKGESDRAAVILGAAKLDALLAQVLDRHFLPSLASNDELLDGDSPLSTFSSRINISYRLGLITSDFAKALHLVRRIRNAFAHEISGVSLSSGSHSDRLRSLLLPFLPLPFFKLFRKQFFGEETPQSNFRTCLALMVARLEHRLNATEQVGKENAWNVIVKSWANTELTKEDEADKSAT